MLKISGKQTPGRPEQSSGICFTHVRVALLAACRYVVRKLRAAARGEEQPGGASTAGRQQEEGECGPKETKKLYVCGAARSAELVEQS